MKGAVEQGMSNPHLEYKASHLSGYPMVTNQHKEFLQGGWDGVFGLKVLISVCCFPFFCPDSVSFLIVSLP
jgi:hypothetical protein